MSVWLNFSVIRQKDQLLNIISGKSKTIYKIIGWLTDQEWWLQLAFYDADLSCLRNVRCENRSVAAGCESDNRQLGSDVNE